ncbi:MAG TPA: hypothetical protein VM870_08910, partial [Pyrinomonadaceae bacterium]|nr:hypothetical protein [Pyrinomonadaceae bacterium]
MSDELSKVALIPVMSCWTLPVPKVSPAGSMTNESALTTVAPAQQTKRSRASKPVNFMLLDLCMIFILRDGEELGLFLLITALSGGARRLLGDALTNDLNEARLLSPGALTNCIVSRHS